MCPPNTESIVSYSSPGKFALPHCREAAAEFEIRHANTQDLDNLVSLENTCFAAGPYRDHQFDKANYRYHLNNPQSTVLIATSQDQFVGTAILTLGTRSRSHIGRAISIAVGPNFRRCGIGTSLMKVAIGELRQQGCRYVYLEVSTERAAASSIFQQIGFKRARALPNYYGPGIHGVRMKLDLTSSEA